MWHATRWNSRDWAKSYVSSPDPHRDGPAGHPPMAVEHHIPKKFSPLDSWPDDTQDIPLPTGVDQEEEDAEETVVPTGEPLAVEVTATEPEHKETLDAFVDPSGRALQGECSRLS